MSKEKLERVSAVDYEIAYSRWKSFQSTCNPRDFIRTAFMAWLRRDVDNRDIGYHRNWGEDYWELPLAAAKRIRMLLGPHYYALLRAEQIQREADAES